MKNSEYTAYLTRTTKQNSNEEQNFETSMPQLESCILKKEQT